MTTPVLDVREVSKTFGAITAARDLSLQVGEGARIGIIGTNGAGKTTFVNLVTGWIRPSSGTIAFRGHRISGQRPPAIARLGIGRSFQVPQLFDSATTLENLVLAAAATEMGTRFDLSDAWTDARAEACRRVLARYLIDAYANKIVATLPQGVRKLVDIAMAMSHRPALLLLDEPTSGVSIDEKFEAMELVMGALRDEAVAVLFVEHDMDIVERYADRVLAFAEGRVIADGSPREVLTDPLVSATIVGEGRLVREAACA